MNFKCWLESYKDIDHEKEGERVQGINMTAGLPWSDRPPLDQIRELTRGFHLNTIIGRMMQQWVVGLNFAPVDHETVGTDPQKAYRWRISKTDRRGNDAYKAAYELFKQEIANAVSSLPFKTGLNVISGKPEDVLAKSKDFFRAYQAEDKGLIESLEAAWKIFVGVFGLRGSETQKRNFLNFMQIVQEEFMTIGEMLPTMGDDNGTRRVNNSLVKRLNGAIKKFEAVKTI
jgi:hypothetical protein